ncbi:MAG TPA: glucose-6-phosphate isomerase [Myxococcota bacterium]|nr:glucose-6-phosphate isomerase [Myxococcota bacterium]
MGLVALDSGRREAALEAMRKLEAGAIANPDEGRRVGHYWLRAPGRSPEGPAIAAEWEAIEALARKAEDYDHLVLCGIGGSALGPQLLASALPRFGLRPVFLDNTDPVGVADALDDLELSRALILVVSKSGGTKETKNNLAEVRARCPDLAERAVAITCEGSPLWDEAEGWLARLRIWDWVGGRTSVTSAVGLLPMALMGQDWRGLLRGAAAMDEATRAPEDNPALMLAEAWWQARPRAMVVLPYRDRLALLGRYLQQLVSESLGKEGQGITVYGNKGSTDQHAYVQQLRDGPDDFFATFVHGHGRTLGVEVEPGVHSADYLVGFLIGTRKALSEAGRRSLTIILDDLTAVHLGALIALHERAVGFYASFAGINAYHQPGVEAGKRGAAEALRLIARLKLGEDLDHTDDVELLADHLRRTRRL